MGNKAFMVMGYYRPNFLSLGFSLKQDVLIQ